MGRFVITLTVVLGFAGIALHSRIYGLFVTDTATNAKKVQIWVDQSSSICEEQRTKWRGYAELVLQKLQPNDRLEIFDISDATSGTSPRFTGVVPQLPTDATKSDGDQYQQDLTAFQNALRHALDGAFAGGQRHISSTDVFSLFSRFRPDPQRQGFLFLLTDGLHVDGAEFKKIRINMEQHLADLNISSFVREVSGRYRFDDRTLAHAKVTLLLPDAAVCPHLPKEDVSRVKEIYTALIAAAGGSLNQVETYLNGGEL